MIETLMLGTGFSIPPKSDYISAEKVGLYGHALGALASDGTDLFQYGGYPVSDTPDYNFRIHRTTDPFSSYYSTITALPGVQIKCPHMIVRNGIAYIFGNSSSDYFTVAIYDIAANSVLKVLTYSAIAPINVPGYFFFNEVNETIYYKASGDAHIIEFSLKTEAFSRTLRLYDGFANVVSTQYIFVIGNYLYTAGGWSGSAHAGRQYRINLTTKVCELWFEHGNEHGSVNQMAFMVDNVIYYPTWTDNMFLTAYNPVTRKVNILPGKILPGGYRNGTAGCADDKGFYWGGGSQIPMGNSNWLTYPTRDNSLFYVKIKE